MTSGREQRAVTPRCTQCNIGRMADIPPRVLAILSHISGRKVTSADVEIEDGGTIVDRV